MAWIKRMVRISLLPACIVLLPARLAAQDDADPVVRPPCLLHLQQIQHTTDDVLHCLSSETALLRQTLNDAAPHHANRLLTMFRKDVDALISILYATPEQTALFSEPDQMLRYLRQPSVHAPGSQGAPVLPADLDTTMPGNMAKLERAGLRYVDMSEGEVAIHPQPQFLLDLFGAHVSADYRHFLRLESQKNKHLPGMGQYNYNDWPMMGKRLAAWEHFLEQYPDSPLAIQAKRHYGYEQSLYLVGGEYTPAIDSETGKVVPILQQEWRSFARQHPRSLTTRLIRLLRDQLHIDPVEKMQRIQRVQSQALEMDMSQ
ncbi:MAG: hypothetical protein Q4G39_02150 [Brachymonas sp.]|nr:hypothetical protein [Brachymonas sp.]